MRCSSSRYSEGRYTGSCSWYGLNRTYTTSSACTFSAPSRDTPYRPTGVSMGMATWTERSAGGHVTEGAVWLTEHKKQAGAPGWAAGFTMVVLITVVTSGDTRHK